MEDHRPIQESLIVLNQHGLGGAPFKGLRRNWSESEGLQDVVERLAQVELDYWPSSFLRKTSWQRYS